MSAYKYMDLKVIYCRTHHLLQGFPPFLSDQQLKELNYDFVSVATEERRRGLLDYIKVS